MNRSMKWLDDVRGTDSIREVARRVDMNQGTLNRQANLDQISFETVRDISRAYGRPVLADLVSIGHLDTSDISTDDIANALNAATDAQLVAAVANRLGVDLSIFDKPVSQAFSEAANITHLHRNVPGITEDEEDLPAVARPAETEPTDEQ